MSEQTPSEAPDPSPDIPVSPLVHAFSDVEPLAEVVRDIAVVVDDEQGKRQALDVRVHALEMQLRVAWTAVVVLATANVVLTCVDLVYRYLDRH